MINLNIIPAFTQNAQNLLNVTKESVDAISINVQPWNGLNLADLKKSYDQVYELVRVMHTNGSSIALPFNIINTLASHINNVSTHVSNFIRSPNQQTFQTAIQQIETFSTIAFQFNILNFVEDDQETEKLISNFQEEYSKILEKSAEIENLRGTIKGYIDPLAANALSKSFSDRKDFLYSGRKVWLFVSIIFGFLSIAGSTWAIVETIHNLELIELIIALASFNKQTPVNIPNITLTLILLRIALTAPFFFIFGYALKQYSKERNFEEEYAHKSAVSTSLPEYGNLAGNSDVKNRIVSAATEVIFSSPISNKDTKSEEETKNLYENLLSSINQLLKNQNDA